MEKEIRLLIGKEPGQGRLMVALVDGRNIRQRTLAYNLPGSVSRCRPNENVAHCELVISPNGAMRLTNMKKENVTAVDGRDIANIGITEQSKVTLGKDKFALPLQQVINVGRAMAAELRQQTQTPPPTPQPIGGTKQRKNPPPTPGQQTQGQQKPSPRYSIRHLEVVWNRYHDRQIAIQKRQKQVGLMRSVPMIFTMGAGVISTLAMTNGWPDSVKTISISLTIIGLILMLIGFYLGATDKSIEDRERAQEEFQDHYVCPNPECHHFLGNKPYKLLRQDTKCPYCKVTFVD